MADLLGGFVLPIRRRGRFMKDDFFHGFQKDFDSAIENVMDRYSGRSLLADQFSNYRKLREMSHDPNTGPAASISETNDVYMIVLDLSDYVHGSIAVRTRGRYAVVEASYDSNSFTRRYPLPKDTNFDAVFTAMSNEGILTITAPKKGSKKQSTGAEGKNIPESPVEGLVADIPSLKIDVGEPENISKEGKEGASEESNIKTNISIDGEENNSEKEEEGFSPTASDRELQISKKGKFFQDSYFENVWKDFENAMEEMVDKEQRKKKRDTDAFSEEKKELANKLQNDMILEAQKKQQKFFDEAQQRREITSSLVMPKYDRLSSYRNLREWAPINETQAATITKDSKGYKIVMDVKNCSNGDGDIAVKASEGCLTVSGRRGSLNFTKEFSLTGLTNPDQVNASISEDGILTVTADV